MANKPGWQVATPDFESQAPVCSRDLFDTSEFCTLHAFVVRYSARAAWLFEIAFVVTRACLLERPGFKHYQGVASLIADLFITSTAAKNRLVPGRPSAILR